MSFFPRDLAAPAAEPGPAVAWEEPACLLCGNRNWQSLVEAPDSTAGGTGLWFAAVQCQECGLCFTNPRPVPECMDQFYPEAYRPHRLRRRKSVKMRSRLLRACHQPRKEYEAFVCRGQGRLLDFGCGSGSFLLKMRELSWNVTGLDVSPAAVERVRQLGLQAFVGTLPHLDLEPASFDLITMWHSLEHVHAPLTVLREARRLLAPGGQLIVAVPNIDSLPFRWFGSAWFGLDLPRHLTHFAPSTLQLMLQRAGFRPGAIRQIRHSNWLRESARLACDRGPFSPWHWWLRTKHLSKLVTLYAYVTRQCDCLVVVSVK
jgi:SAM-dependent methyltransferase